MMATWTQNLITILLIQMRLTTIQAKHPYTAPEAKYHFTIQLMKIPPEEEELDNMDDTQLPELETQVPVLHQSKRVSVPLSN